MQDPAHDIDQQSAAVSSTTVPSTAVSSAVTSAGGPTSVVQTSAAPNPATPTSAAPSSAVRSSAPQAPAVKSAVGAIGEYHSTGRNLPNEPPQRLIKRYSNRKLYDTEASRYITLLEVAQLVLEGAPIRVVDNATREDKTELTFAQIILEQLKSPAPEGTGSRLTEIIRECQLARNLAAVKVEPAVDRESPSLSPSSGAETSHADLPWRERFESQLALLPPSQAAGLRAHWQDLSNRLTELQHQLTAETENRDPGSSRLE
jgi:polyhydroxyalkanoate synthesis repressor PhaR